MGYSETPTKGPAMPEFVYPVLIAFLLIAVYCGMPAIVRKIVKK